MDGLRRFCVLTFSSYRPFVRKGYFGLIKVNKKMKKNFFYWLIVPSLVLMSFCVVSCSDDDAAAELNVDVQQLLFSAEGQSQTFRITSNTDWVIVGNTGWLTVNPAMGSGNQSIVVTASENTTVSPRTCQLSVTTASGEINRMITVEQSATSEELSVDVSRVNLDGAANSSAYLHITTNAAWSITGVPDWLTLSSVSGNGTAQITLTAISDNASSSQRNCTLTINAGAQTEQVEVIQRGLLASGCEVTPNIVVALADGIAFDFTYGANVSYYYVALYDPDWIERMTDAEIIEEMSSDINNRDTPQDGYVTSWRNLSPLTEYTVCTVGFDDDGNHGDLQKMTLTTKNGSNQARATISDVTYDSMYWNWTTSTNAFVTRYYQWYVPYSDLYDAYDAGIAWFFKQAMEESPNDFPPISRGDTWYRERNGETVFHLVTWAVNVEGEFSGVIDRWRGHINSSSSKVQRHSISKNDNPFRSGVVIRK